MIVQASGGGCDRRPVKPADRVRESTELETGATDAKATLTPGMPFVSVIDGGARAAVSSCAERRKGLPGCDVGLPGLM